MKLFVDDERECPEGWIVARSYDEALTFLGIDQKCQVSDLSIDHDLGEGKSGYDLACWLEERLVYGYEVPVKITCHSANPVGRARIEQCLASIRRMQENER